MDTYANMLLIAIPVFFVSALLEALYGNWIKDQKHNFMDTVSSLTSGITNLLYDLLGIENINLVQVWDGFGYYVAFGDDQIEIPENIIEPIADKFQDNPNQPR